MAFEQSQLQSSDLRQVPTAHLAQTMSLLSMTMAELHQKIDAELSTNPALELIEERRCPNCGRFLHDQLVCSICSQPKNQNLEEPVVFLSDRLDFTTYSYQEGEGGTDLPDDNYAPVVDDLATFVMRQVAPDLAPEDRIIAAHILTSLDDDGLLPISVLEIAQYHHIAPSRVENVIRLIQHSEPTGVGSHTPQEALLIQLEVLGENHVIPSLAEKTIREGMDYLSKRQYNELARHLGTTAKIAKEIAQFISDNLNPYPARTYWGDIHHGASIGPNTYVHPDVIISLLDEKNLDSTLVVEILMPFRGTLQINTLFRQAAHDADPEKMEQWKSDLDRASLLVKCLKQRYYTMRRLMYLITKQQREFILRGDSFLVPVTRASLSKVLNVHESTISRAVAGKTIQIPNGQLIPLDRFFDRSLHIRAVLRRIIEEEGRPLSDTQIMTRLKNSGLDVARRTVAKYRAMEGILPARLRHPAQV